jgi:phage replication initiation protein
MTSLNSSKGQGTKGGRAGLRHEGLIGQPLTSTPCPPALTGGESPTNAIAGAAKVDWLTVTWKPDHDEHVPAMVHDLLKEFLGGVMGQEVPGMLGYDSGIRFYVPYDGAALSVARLDFGGDHHGSRARLDISGAGCSRLRNLACLRNRLEGFAESKLTRVDLALDFLEGEFSVDDAAEWYRLGEFNSGGRMPRHSTIGDWLSDQSKHGRTLEVGRRANGKMIRCYEKGKQLGDQSSLWTRFEVELRNNDRDLPFDLLTDCDRFFVGAYKCLQRLIESPGEKIPTHQKEGEIALEVMTEYARSSYGPLLHVLRIKGLSMDQIFEEISRPGVPRRLEKAALGGFLNSGSPPVH